MIERDLIKIFLDEIYSNLPKKNYPSDKIECNHFDESWSFDLADMIVYKISNNKGFTYIFVITDKVNKHSSTEPPKNKNS